MRWHLENLNLVGDFYGQPFRLRPWQQPIIRRLFATSADGRQIVRRFLLLLPRKVGKTYLAAVIGLYALLTRGRNQVVISAAASQEQANRIFDAMKEIIEQDEYLKEICEVTKSTHRISVEATNSYYVACTSGGRTAHGHNPTVVILDELHCWNTPNHRELYTALTTGRGARKNPLTILISTQSADRTSIAFEEFEYARKVKGRIENGEVRTDGTIDNPQYLAVLYFADPAKDDWLDERLWHRVAPGLGDYVDLEEYREQCGIAKEIPSRRRNFQILYLNMPVDDSAKWLDMNQWNDCKNTAITEASLLGRECFAALDLAPVRDLSALILLFPVGDKLQVLPYFWCPEASILQRSKDEGVAYDDWKSKKHIIGTPGDTTDFDLLRRDINALGKKFKIKKLTADASFAHQLGQQLIGDGFDVSWHKQEFRYLSPPMNRTEKLIIDKTLQHPGQPCLDYCMGNVIPEYDQKGEMRPSNKLRLRQDKIDGAISLIMSVSLWMASQDIESIYDNRSLQFF